ncbi:MAG: cell division protein ZapA [Eubacterium sp.]|jgi:cell division protein ZapA (FtsZ GTPase activity inhibitor)|nr:cell division protein ZapA [Eubacterium sp.]
MDKVKVQICNRSYNLVTDGGTDRLTLLAKNLEGQIAEHTKHLKNRSEIDILTLVALNILDESERELARVIQDAENIKNNLFESEKKLKEAMDENIYSANRELEQIATFKDIEKEELRKKLMEYEENFDKLVEEKVKEIGILTDGVDSARSEMEHIASVVDSENEKLRNTLNSFEKTFDEYSKLKEAEIIKLREELESSRADCDTLRQRLAALDDEGQMTIC